MRKNSGMGPVGIACHRCDAVAATLTVYEDEGRAALVRTGFDGDHTAYGDASVFARTIELAVQGRYAELHDRDRDMFGFICRVCAAPYCQACWTNRVWHRDEGFFDYEDADCPNGHRQMICD